MNARLAASVLGAAVLGALGWAVGRAVTGLAASVVLLSLAGIVVGLLLTPVVLSGPLRRFDTYLRDAPVADLSVALVGLGAGLIIAGLLAFPLALLGPPIGNLLPIVVALVIALVCMRVALVRHADIRALPLFTARTGHAATAATDSTDAIDGAPASNGRQPQILLDTSVIIDGRIADINASGFIIGDIVVPQFILDELRHIAGSPDVLRRTRGRRGLDMLNRMREEEGAPVTIVDMDPREVQEVDAKLVYVARKLHASIVTTDFSLNKVAQLQGVRVLNVNELANAVKPIVLPNEEMSVKIIQAGKELGQGVGYLDDGTMIVVEDGTRHIDQEVDIVVTRVLQTVAGRMIFATLKGQNTRGPFNGNRR
jgi:uncharacterized protein YacL